MVSQVTNVKFLINTSKDILYSVLRDSILIENIQNFLLFEIFYLYNGEKECRGLHTLFPHLIRSLHSSKMANLAKRIK